MPLTSAQKKLIVDIDAKAKTLQGSVQNEAALLLELLPFMDAIKAMIESVPYKELEMYFYQYDGFYHSMKLLETATLLLESVANETAFTSTVENVGC